MATAAAAVVARARREIQHHFFAADAVRADRAVPFTPSNRIEARQFARLMDRNVIRREGADRYWLDVVAYDEVIQTRYRRVRMVLLVLAVVLLVLGLTLAMRG